ncbi:ABC transporter ATP-binding protein [Virgisporangium aliadipatigenens]|uniref:ABC transporter ATP-binding protein n=1 Tax=Virgisporangium aliadipatigenens TaxID=741659 RepID=A0A8J3YXP0_9ACTN|nr:ABC transporter ATP-binding protein [Virgisporangium aliadipatigenens]
MVVIVVWPSSDSYTTQEQRITVRTGPAGDQSVTLDATLYLPKEERPVPAVLLAHGFGGTKRSVDTDARELAELGYAVLTWTAQGFGRSTGEIHLNSPDWEVKDAQGLIDWLAARPEVRKTGANDPVVAAVGGSYGGALSLLLAGVDQRVDAIVPMITWNDLANAFLPEATGRGPENGVFKRQWAGLFFGSGSAALGAGGDLSALLGGGGPGPESGADPQANPQCGRFAADVCAAYLDVATTGKASPETIALLRRSSPASVAGTIKAPTLLIQGEADSLFPLSEGDANARAIAANGTPVRVAWFTGGHDGGEGPGSDQDRLKFLTAQWLDHYLKKNGDAPSRDFVYSRTTGLDATNRDLVASGYSVKDYPGVAGRSSTAVEVQGRPTAVANPPSGTPGALSTLPGGLSSFVGGAGLDVPGQFARYVSAPFESTVDVVGAPTVKVRAASPTGEAVLFVKLYAIGNGGTSSLPGGQVAPIRLTGLPATLDQATPVTVTLPAIVHQFERGHRLAIALSTSDQAFASPVQPAVYQVAVEGPVTLPSVAGTPIADPNLIWWYLLGGLLAAILLGLVIAIVVARLRGRRRDRSVNAEHADTPLVVRGLRKEYADFVAVESVSFTVNRGQVVGLLGPNGAGKTTSLRVLMGLTRATAGEILVFGHRLEPGAPVLSRLGALVEGPGFLPHLTGIANLRLYWKSTGRPEADADFEQALEIAGLGGAVNRRVRTYSHGMRQRLAIAQAMLGMPELLVLDEPTDGLDPPQIAEMRQVLRRYATDGRAVLVSSHLLAEVEQTCTDVVVMNKGKIVASGKVAEIVGDSPTVQLEVSDVDTATAVLTDLGVRSVTPSEGGLVVDVNGTPRQEVVAALVRAGVGVDRVVPRRRLEDAFLSLVGGDTKASGER